MSQSQAQSVLATAVQNQPKKRGCRRGCQGCLVAVVLLAVPFVWFNIPTPLRVSEETTYVLGPMTADGKRIDYFRAMEERFYPPEMKTDENGYRLLVRATGVQFLDKTRTVFDPNTREYIQQEFDPEPFRLQVYEKLGLDPNEEPTLKQIESPHAFIAQYDKEHLPAEEEQNLFTRYGQRGHQYWTFDDFPMFQDWYEENTAAIDLLGEAVRKPTFFIPYVREHEKESMFDSWGSVMSVQVVREWARAAQARANYRLGIGDIDGAIDDIITIRLLGRHTGKQGTIVAGLVGIALEGMGVAVGIGSNPEFPPTKEQIERLIRELDALPPRWTVTEAIESERYFGLGVLYDFYWGTSPGMHSNIFPLMFFPNWSIDINVALARHNQLYDALVTPEAIIDVTALPSFYKGIDLITTDRSDGGRQKKRAKIRKSWNPLPLLFVRSRTNRFMDTLAAVSIPALLGSHHTWERAECFENLQRLTLALLLYEQDHGSLPDGDWRIAVKPYLGENAERYFRCPSHPDLAEDETIYAMVGGVPNASPSPTQILLVELREPQKLGEGDGRIPFEQARYGNHPNEPRPLGSVLGSNHAGGITVGVRSGVVQFISQTIHSDVWQRRLDGSAETLP